MTEPSQNHSEFARLYADSQSRLFAFICSLLGSYDSARDVLQETNAVMWEKRETFEIGTNFTAWSFRIARFQVMAFREKQSRDRLVFSDKLIERVAEEVGVFNEQHEQRQAALDQCLNVLPRKQSALIQLRYRSGESVNQIAEQLGKPANTIAVQLHRIRQALIDCVQRRLGQKLDQGLEGGHDITE